MRLIVLPDTSEDAATNMAIDASLLLSLPQDTAVFRHYGWSKPAATFGYTQYIDQVRNVFAENIQLCRRLTGGGIVDHRNDWTYALVLHSHLEAAQIPATKLYATIHQCIQEALADQSIDTRLAPCPRTCEQAPAKPVTGPDKCFMLPAANDVIHPNGIKIAGAAMKRNREGLLAQGSIDRSALPNDFDFQGFSTAFSRILADALNLNLSKDYKNLPKDKYIQRERQRFESVAWTHKR